MNKRYSGTQAVDRAVALLRAFGPDPAPLTPQELSQRTSLNRATVYRLLSALEHTGFVASDGSGRYRLGPELIALGGLAVRGIDLREVALPHLRALAIHSGETVDLEVLRDGNVLIIEEVTGSHLLTTSGNLGQTYPAWRTSTGKILLSYLPEEQREALYQLPSWPKASALATLRTEIALARHHGYATSYEELEPHLHAVGAVILDHTDCAVAAVSISGPAARLPRSQEAQHAVLVRIACAAISHQLGNRNDKVLR
jgi:DNA-binding IclR family transcriptional regulator